MNSTTRFTLRTFTMCFGIALGALMILSLAGAVHTVRAQDPPAEKVAYSFRPVTGYYPTGVIGDPAGNLYVATDYGGSDESCIRGCGNILKVSPSGQATELYAFTHGSPKNKYGPIPTGLTRDAKGIFYGTTGGGGRYGLGSVFKLTPSGDEGTLHSFGSGTDGAGPSRGPTIDSAGNLYGTTQFGGGSANCLGGGCGAIYKVTPSGSETVLYSFTAGADGAFPMATPALDAAGDLYGTAEEGGDFSCPLFPRDGCGTVWKLDTSGNFTVLYSFTGGTDGAAPIAGLILDSSGNLYGTAGYGGDLTCGAPDGCGVVFMIDSSGNFTVLHTFTGGSNDGQEPQATLLRDSAANLYGTTLTGGDQSCADSNGEPGCGVVFKLDSSDNETLLHTFIGGTTDGALPAGGALISDGKGNLYGTTLYGGVATGGVIFEVQAR
jgi:uncharacterized repeat protein (TIGR03803 family)